MHIFSLIFHRKYICVIFYNIFSYNKTGIKQHQLEFLSVGIEVCLRACADFMENYVERDFLSLRNFSLPWRGYREVEIIVKFHARLLW